MENIENDYLKAWETYVAEQVVTDMLKIFQSSLVGRIASVLADLVDEILIFFQIERIIGRRIQPVQNLI